MKTTLQPFNGDNSFSVISSFVDRKSIVHLLATNGNNLFLTSSDDLYDLIYYVGPVLSNNSYRLLSFDNNAGTTDFIVKGNTNYYISPNNRKTWNSVEIG